MIIKKLWLYDIISTTFSPLYTTFKNGIAAAGEPIPSEKGRFGDWLQQHQLQQTSALAVALRQKGSVLSKVGYSIPPVNPTYFEILSS